MFKLTLGGLAKAVGALIASSAVAVVLLVGGTLAEIRDVPSDFASVFAEPSKAQFTDRTGIRLSSTYVNDWNITDTIHIHDVPSLVLDAFVTSEDKRFFRHRGQDWIARLAAVYANVVAWSKVRGASTITEQVVRMLHSRPRTLWSRWIEGWEAVRLERSFSKNEILEFYINQVPYASNRRGIVQGARHYFSRDLTSLSESEILALVVMVRAPSVLHPDKNVDRVLRSVQQLQERLGVGSDSETVESPDIAFRVQRQTLSVESPHFVRYSQSQLKSAVPSIRTSLVAEVQKELQESVRSTLGNLQHKNVDSAALLVVDLNDLEVVAWVVATTDPQHADYDTILLKRQPGSTLKPFLFAMALERGWTASTLISDTPLSERVAEGMHHYRNYSNSFRGPVTLRSALGNSLNIPAVRTLRFVGGANFLTGLRELGLTSLAENAKHYGGGLALGNAEVSLFELVRAYATLANRGVYRDLWMFRDVQPVTSARRVYSGEVSSIVTSILSDPTAREMEFGSGVLNLPIQTAIKTGTSTAFRDSWAVGYNSNFVVGSWMGNLDGQPMRGVTGSIGPAVAVRGAFDLLNRRTPSSRLWMSPRLQTVTVCVDTGYAATNNDACPTRTEYFIEGTGPLHAQTPRSDEPSLHIRLVDPTPNLELAVDPRIPLERQAYEFKLAGVDDDETVNWIVDGQQERSTGANFLWPLSKGQHLVQASVERDGSGTVYSNSVPFHVY